MKQTPRPSTPPSGQPLVPRSDGAHPPEVARAMALRDVLHQVVELTKEASTSARARPRKGFVVSFCLFLIALSAYSWVERPEAIWGPAARPIPSAQQEAGVRFSMFLLSQRVEAYRDSTGHYPSALGDQGEGISYALASDSVFELRATNNGQAIVFRSNESAEEFLGNSMAVITAGAR